MSSDFYATSIVPFAPIIIKICRAYTNTQEDFEDYYQEVCLQIWRSHRTFDERAAWSTWIYRVSLNVCLTLLKTQKRNRRLFRVRLRSSRARGRQSGVRRRVSQSVVRRDSAAVRSGQGGDPALSGREAVLEIGEIIGTNPNNVGVRINRVKDRLRRLLDEKDNRSDVA